MEAFVHFCFDIEDITIVLTQQPLHPECAYTIEGCAAPGVVCITGAWAASGRVYTTIGMFCTRSWLRHKGLSCIWTCLHLRGMCCSQKCLNHRGLWCSWRCLHHRGLNCIWPCLYFASFSRLTQFALLYFCFLEITTPIDSQLNFKLLRFALLFGIHKNMFVFFRNICYHKRTSIVSQFNINLPPSFQYFNFSI
jgi:hypothetical protein